MTKDKRFWVNVAAGTVAVIAIAFGVKQCSDKNVARDSADTWRNEVTKSNGAMTDAINTIREYGELTEDLQGIIAQKDSTIAVLRDSLDVCREAKACKCKTNTAKVGCGCAKKPAPVKKTTPAKPAPAKPAPVCDPKPVVEVVSGENKVIVRDTDVKPNQQVIVNGDNSGTIIVNANGIVNGVNTPSASDNRKQMMRGYSVTSRVYLGTRSKCK